jgi:hypothetical protein
MSLRIGENSYYYGYEILTEDAPSGSENTTAQVEETQVETTVAQRSNPKLPSIPNSVDFTALGIDTELKLARAAYMAAAARAGISDTSAQRRFADQMIAANSSELKLTDGNIPLDDAKVKARLTNREVRFSLSEGEKSALREFRRQYINEGGRIRSNQNPTVDLRQAQTADGVNLPPTTPVKTKFRVLLNNNGRPISEQRVLAQYAQDQYGGGNLWGENYRQIAELSSGQGVKPKITNITRLGDKIAVDFELTPLNRAVIHENYKTVQAQVNRAEAIYRDIADNNELSSFLRGVFNGAVKSVKGTIDLVLDLPGTLKALWQVVSHPVETFNALKTELSETWEEFKNASPSKKAEMVGELVGSAVVEILIGKGIGKAGGILAKTKTGAKLLEEAGNLKKAGALKIAETFSDDAAEIARQSAKNRLRQLSSQLNSGLPIDPQLLKDLSVIAGNKVKNGAIKFADFTRQMVDDFGEAVRPHLEKIYREAMEKLGHKVDDAEILSLNKPTIKVRPEAGTPEHKALRWEEYQAKNADNPKALKYETWSKIYDVNMQQARKSNIAVQAYQKKVGWGKTEVTVDVEPGVSRRLDIADVDAKKAIEHKTGYISLDEDIKWELQRDKKLVEQGWNITWHFEGTASKPLLKELLAAGINVTFK